MTIKTAIIEGKMNGIIPLIEADLKKGIKADIILRQMIEGMEDVGDLFEKKEYYVPETLLSAHTMKLGLELLRPLLTFEKGKDQGKVIIGVVESDIHDIGLNLVAMFLEAAGFEIHNLGRDVPTTVFLEKAEEIQPDIIGLSAMMSTTALRLKEVIKELKTRNKNEVYFVVGGAALSDEFAREIGANGYASDAKKAIRVFEELMEREG
jgi:methylmalonyl-CoA mutase cobalamin-binding domain/chain